ncbi:MAG: hypothetical protein ABI668_07860 [Sphingorhabdus sp.]
MRYFVPDIVLNAPSKSGGGLLRRHFGEKSEISPPAIEFEEKLGGLPYGLPSQLWPTCEDCGKSQSFLAQFKHHVERLDLGAEGRAIYIFQCDHDPGMCQTWDTNSGANACVVVNQEDFLASVTPLPNDNPPIENCVGVSRWISKDDGIAPEVARLFYSQQCLDTVDLTIIEKVTYSTRLGGVPSWIQSADDSPGKNWRFLGQLDSLYSFLTPPDRSEKWISEDRAQSEGRTHIGQGPNFGDIGIAYLFAKEGTEGGIAVKMFWQCS